MILEKKQQVSIAQLCQGCPSQFAEFLAYARSLKFDAKPDIPYLRKLFMDLFHAQGFAGVGKIWDWDNLDAEFLSNGNITGSGLPPQGPMLMSDDLIGKDDAMVLERPNTAVAVAPRPTSSWGFSSRAQATDFEQAPMPMNSQAAAKSGEIARPHTASAVPGSRPGPGGGNPKVSQFNPKL
jgi:hypothetical protein